MNQPSFNDTRYDLLKKLVGNVAGFVPTPPTTLFPLTQPDLSFYFDSKENVAVGGGNAVTSWTDLSQAAQEVTQSDATARPILTAGSTPNGSPSLVFDGVNDFLRLINPGVSGLHTTYLVLSMITTSDGQHVFDGSTNDDYLFYDGPDFNYVNTVAHIRPPNGEFFIVSLVNGILGNYIQVNLDTSGPGGSGGGNWDGFTVGMSRAPFNTANSNIAVCAIAQYTVEHNESKRAEFAQFFATRFGFSL